MLEKLSELFLFVNVGAGRDQGAAGESLVEAGIVPPVELVDGQLPDGLAAGRAVVAVAVAFVRHSEKRKSMIFFREFKKRKLESH